MYWPLMMYILLLVGIYLSQGKRAGTLYSMHFVKQDRRKVDELMAKLKIPSVLPVEHEFILEYLSMMSPIAKALDSLQGETNVFLGSALPCLTKMRAQLVKLNLKGNGAQAVRDLLLSLIEKRFGNLFLIMMITFMHRLLIPSLNWHG